MQPFRLEPYLRPMVWGGRRLGERLGKPLPDGLAYGESWDVSDHPSHRSVVATGPHAGQTLRDLMERQRGDLLGVRAAATDTFPWLVKFLDAHDWLSVQVHPDEVKVRRLLPGEGPKTEAWFILEADPDGLVYAGLLPGINEKKLREALAAGAVADCLHRFRPRPGDCVFLPAGTVHAMGGGLLLAELQQTSDATFRLFDWNRKDAQGKSRQLHVEESMAAIDWRQGPVQPVATEFARPDCEQRLPLVECPFFRIDFVQSANPFACAGAGRLQALIVLRGRGTLRTESSEEAFGVGEAWVLPASSPRVECAPDGPASALLCTLP